MPTMLSYVDPFLKSMISHYKVNMDLVKPDLWVGIITERCCYRLVNFGELAFDKVKGPSMDIGLNTRPNIMGHDEILGGSYSGMG